MVNMPNRPNVDVRFRSIKGAHGPKRSGLCELFGQSDCTQHVRVGRGISGWSEVLEVSPVNGGG